MSIVESHLASNVHKSRLVQKDLLVAKKLQEEEDKRAKVQNQRQHEDMWVSHTLTLTHTHTCKHTIILYMSVYCTRLYQKQSEKTLMHIHKT